MKLVDANVLIYAAGDEHPYKEPSLRLLRLVREGAIEANTDVEVLQEILHYYQRRGRVELGVGVLNHTLALFPDPLGITVPMVVAAAETLRQHPRLQTRDALHAAVVIEAGLEGIVSADRGFDAVPEIERFDPAEL
ncbi:MAG: type II toxin-antitoxin system VapC family toxin [Dehalococcoidia bacterium]